MKGIYDRKKWFWKKIEDTVLFCAAGPSGGGILFYFLKILKNNKKNLIKKVEIN